jgi:hypothetical protein
MLRLPRASQFIFIRYLPFSLASVLLAAWLIDLERTSPASIVVALAAPAPTVQEPPVPEPPAPFQPAPALPVPSQIAPALLAPSLIVVATLVPSSTVPP